MVTETLDRSRLRMVQTPQAFALRSDRSTPIGARRRRAVRILPTMRRLSNGPGIAYIVFEGEAGNVKLTTNDDFARAELLSAAALADVRIGSGFDVHAFVDGDHVMLGGVRIPHRQRRDGPFRC